MLFLANRAQCAVPCLAYQEMQLSAPQHARRCHIPCVQGQVRVLTGGNARFVPIAESGDRRVCVEAWVDQG